MLIASPSALLLFICFSGALCSFRGRIPNEENGLNRNPPKKPLATSSSLPKAKAMGNFKVPQIPKPSDSVKNSGDEDLEDEKYYNPLIDPRFGGILSPTPNSSIWPDITGSNFSAQNTPTWTEDFIKAEVGKRPNLLTEEEYRRKYKRTDPTKDFFDTPSGSSSGSDDSYCETFGSASAAESDSNSEDSSGIGRVPGRDFRAPTRPRPKKETSTPTASLNSSFSATIFPWDQIKEAPKGNEQQVTSAEYEKLTRRFHQMMADYMEQNVQNSTETPMTTEFTFKEQS